MRSLATKFGVLAAAVLVFGFSGGTVQASAQDTSAKLHGHVNNAAGQPVKGGEIRLTQDRTAAAKDRKFKNQFPIDQNGDYKGAGIVPGSYLVLVYQDDKTLDFQDDVKFVAAEDKTVNFDMSRKEYMDKMTPEERKAVEEFKKANAEAVAGNAKVANLNGLLTQARADNKSGNYDAAMKAMLDATAAKPDESILWITMGDAQLGQADALQKAAKTAHTNPADPAIQQKYTDAAASYKKGVDLNAAAKKPNPETAGAAYNQMGQALGKMGNVKDASAAYEEAAKAQPASSAMYYFNEAATFFNADKKDDAAVAAEKAITADPKRADAYYIKGQSLIAKATFDSKTNKFTAPPGCVEAYQKYIELAPDGPRAEEVKQILTGIGASVRSNYKAGKK